MRLLRLVPLSVFICISLFLAHQRVPSRRVVARSDVIQERAQYLHELPDFRPVNAVALLWKAHHGGIAEAGRHSLHVFGPHGRAEGRGPVNQEDRTLDGGQLGRTTSTGPELWRTTRSVTLPSTQRPTPERPCVAMTTS